MRRTSSIDGFRPNGPRGDVILTGRARDIFTDADGAARTLEEACIDVRIDWIGGQTIREVRTSPEVPAAQALVGTGARVGFRRTFAQLLPERWGDGSTVTLLFDELPITSSLSRHALIQRGEISLLPADADPAAKASLTPLHRSGTPICAAWVPGGAYEKARDEGRVPLLTEGLPAPPLTDPSDPDAWHHLPELVPGAFRRCRRIDVTSPESDGSPLHVGSLLRDTYVDVEGQELVIHEYEVAMTVDPRNQVVLSAVTTPRSLPGPECSAASASSERIVGLKLDDLRETVRSEFVGVSTCSHLNDHLRALGDVHRLAGWLDGGKRT